jgi:hypothetical protein
MVNSDFVNPIEKLLDLQWCIPALEEIPGKSAHGLVPLLKSAREKDI